MSPADDIASVAASLQDSIGQRLAAYGAGIRHPRQIGRIAAQACEPGATAAGRLRDAHRALTLRLAAEPPAAVRAWLIGANPQLDGESPIGVLHAGESERVPRAAASRS